MSDMKCPFCNGELVGTIGHPICRNQNCVMCDDPMPQDLLEELIRTRKALEQSEICCTEWEKQALDYKAENIALSGDLERTREELHKANAELDYIKEQVEKSNAFIDARIKVAAEQIARGIIAQVKNIKNKKE